MKKALVFATIFALAMLSSCSQTKENDNQVESSEVDSLLNDDATIYGLACDGCNDTIVVFLTLDYDGGDPDTLNVLDATRQHMVFGNIRIGDKLAIVRDEQDSTKAHMLVDLDNMMGEWCQQVLPTLRERADMEGLTHHEKVEQLPDSIRELLHIPHEYTYVFKSDNVLFTIEDTGSKIPSDKADFIFEKFTKIDIFTEGLGLGLFLCRRVVQLMGGSLTLDPQYTGGNRFVLELPLIFDQ